MVTLSVAILQRQAKEESGKSKQHDFNRNTPGWNWVFNQLEVCTLSYKMLFMDFVLEVYEGVNITLLSHPICVNQVNKKRGP